MALLDGEASSTDRMHVMNRTCWCKPEVLRQPSGDDLIVHNEVTWDDEQAVPAGNRFPAPFYESVLRCPEPNCRWRPAADAADRYELYSKHYRAEHNDGGADA